MGKSSGIYYVACCFICDDITINMGRQYWNSVVILCIAGGQSKVYLEVFIAYFRALANLDLNVSPTQTSRNKELGSEYTSLSSVSYQYLFNFHNQWIEQLGSCIFLSTAAWHFSV